MVHSCLFQVGFGRISSQCDEFNLSIHHFTILQSESSSFRIRRSMRERSLECVVPQEEHVLSEQILLHHPSKMSQQRLLWRLLSPTHSILTSEGRFGKYPWGTPRKFYCVKQNAIFSNLEDSSFSRNSTNADSTALFRVLPRSSSTPSGPPQQRVHRVAVQVATDLVRDSVW